MMRERIPQNGKRAIEAMMRLVRHIRGTSRLMPRVRNYPLLGAIFALGVPAGLLLTQSVVLRVWPTRSWIFNEITSQPLTYAYITLYTLILLIVLGYLLGRNSDRLCLLSNTDSLTGLSNRRLFNERLETEMARSTRYKVPLSMMVVDLDHLKGINDNLGHKAGDNAILAVATSLLGSVRAIDIAARIGGDEFAILFPQTTAREAKNQASRFVRNFADHCRDSTSLLSVSVGVSEFDPTVEGLVRGEQFLLSADTALYQAKAAGGGRTIVSKINGASHKEMEKLTQSLIHDYHDRGRFSVQEI